MSLFSKGWLIACILPLAACGFEAVHGPNKAANKIFGKINISVLEGRNAFEFRDRLIERLGLPNGNALYLLNYLSTVKADNLTISKDNDVTRYTLQGETKFSLINTSTKAVIYKNIVISNTAYSATSGTYPTAVAELDANVRLSRDMADKIVTLLNITAKDWLE
ncbi:MAG: LPS assembly lipoprotein LptE [Amylibacter sp.]